MSKAENVRCIDNKVDFVRFFAEILNQREYNNSKPKKYSIELELYKPN
ncbi:protein of unknown function [Petrocella atlantisensis]|uniref:Uncharacterized protein n=1 Tax=Petrocella atlantisensis TaxID=2173034 RepID=A0A3P7S2M5_9FIRM|nr:protein of unknown function [Petrocella atlantisensis]